MSGTGNTGRYGAVLRESQPELPPSVPPKVDAQVVSDAEAAGRVTLAHGRFRMSLPVTVVLAALTCAGGYFASAARRSPDDPSVMLQEFRAEMAAAKGERTESDKALNHRLDAVETGLSEIRSDIANQSTRISDLRADMRGAALPGAPNIAVSNALRGR